MHNFKIDFKIQNFQEINNVHSQSDVVLVHVHFLQGVFGREGFRLKH